MTNTTNTAARELHARVLDTVVLPQYGNDPHKFTMERAALEYAIATLTQQQDGDVMAGLLEEIDILLSAVPEDVHEFVWTQDVIAVLKQAAAALLAKPAGATP